MSVKIGFIGGGNMARSLIGGLLAGGTPPDDILVAEPDPQQRDDIERGFAVRTSPSNDDVARQVDVVLLAVKPQIMRQVTGALADALDQRRHLVISIAAGIRLAHLERWLGPGIPLVRAMPNMPALVKSGATALVANRLATSRQRSEAESILRAVGLTLWLNDESLMDAVTALSGSGPAYFFLIMEALERAGEELGLPAETARLLTLQTAFGAARMALETTTDSAVLRRRVTSPGGTTERALAVLQESHIEQVFARALKAAHERSRELADMLGEE